MSLSIYSHTCIAPKQVDCSKFGSFGCSNVNKHTNNFGVSDRKLIQMLIKTKQTLFVSFFTSGYVELKSGQDSQKCENINSLLQLCCDYLVIAGLACGIDVLSSASLLF